MPKPQAKNSFFYFMLEFKSREQKMGRPMRDLSEVSQKAGVVWQDMSPAERAPYETRAKMEKHKGRTVGEKYSSQGIPLSHIENEKKQKDLAERLMKKEIEDTVKNCFANDSLETQTYYFWTGNYFAKTVDGQFIPAEIAIARYSLKEGIISKFHSFINPGSLPIGMGFQAKSHSDETHRLPSPPNAMGESKFGLLMKEILNFIETDENGQYPPLYTHKKDILMMKSILATLQNEYFGEEEIELKVYPLQYLFFTLKTATAEKGEAKKPESIFISEAIFERDTYEYQHGISCDYHDKLDVGKYCALSCVVRWGYMFSDYMCYDLALDMIPGSHLPIDADLSVPKMSASSSRASFFDDSKSCISVSTRSYVSTTAHSSVTQPKFEQRYLDDSKSVVSNSSFPVLDSDPRKRGHGVVLENESSDEEKADNPWSIRNKNKPRQPKEDSFSFSSVVIGRGRGIKTESALSNASISSRGSGRGRLFQQ